ncbi:BCCT family transporter [Geodermatophilus sabuli]|uniref:Choline/carnitine/betaine transport n=1 Tax=Geodermatophilus sabuli TaxID=1564158 RepID=A0A285E8B0_9ACTN|nr:BCCT family transporter [Geodermatophilus sabuli]MBB3085271.1 choline/carnitine/betaine transport [Geodermatophilus sabuli]SNX95322.1 choline/carnitine/betaine transport [Geodermatophilus sabuli]
MTKTPEVHDASTGSGAHPAVAPPPPLPADRGGSLDRVVFGVAAVVALAFVVWGFASPEGLGSASGSALGWVMHNLGWLFVLLASAFVLFVLWLAASRYGRIPLGRDDEAPEFRTVSWIAMMFSAGMGIGLMFFGVGEPLSHYVSPPPRSVTAETPEAVETAMATTLFHWSLHPWAIYAVVGLAIAYGTFRRGRPQLISAAFAPLFGKRRTEGPAGKVIDVLAIFATLFGSAASLGLGALQIGSGMEILGWAGDVGNGLLVGIIAVLTAAFVASAVSGIAKGIQWLANINMVLALVLALFVFVVGPTVFILDLIPTTVGNYFADLGDMAARTEASGGDAMAAWLSGWTVFYWAWWISWTPFVGLFIARISRGRTIRQFVSGVLLVPSVVSLIWFAVFGGAGIVTQREGADVAGQGTPEGQLFGVLETFPLATVMTVLVMVLVAIFFVSGADAASIVMGSLSERGTIEPSRSTVVFWGVVMGAVAAIMLLVGGDEALTGLQNLTIIAALPFALVMVGLAVALARDVRTDPMMLRRTVAAEAVEQAVVEGITRHGEDFVLVVESGSSSGGTSPVAAARKRQQDGTKQVRDVGSPVPDRDDR